MPYYRLFYHVIWTTKGRGSSITQANRSLIYNAISSKVDGLGGIVHALNGMEDHVHLVVTIPPNIAVGTFIGQIKGSSSHEVSKLYNADSNFAWQTDYGILSISEQNLPTIIDYVKRQQEHHSRSSLNPLLEMLNTH